MARIAAGFINLNQTPAEIRDNGLFTPWFKQGFSQWVDAAACDLAGKLESGYRSLGLDALGNVVAVSRRNANCYIGTPPPVSQLPPQPPSFTGGQCSTIYTVTVEYSTPIAARRGAVDARGPIAGLAVRSGQFADGQPGERLVVLGTSVNGGEEEFSIQRTSTSPRFFDEVIVSIVRKDGQPDDCGNLPPGSAVYPPGEELPPPPAPGEPIRPDEDFDFDFEPSPGAPSIPVTVPITNFNFNPDIGVTFNFGGINIGIRPDFGIDIGVDDNALPEGSSTSEQVESVSDAVEAVQQLLEAPIEGTQAVTLCSGLDLPVSWTGAGLAGLSDQIRALSSQNAVLVQQYCPLLDPSPAPGSLLNSVSFDASSAHVFHDISLPPEAKFCVVRVEGLLTAYAVRATGGNGDEDYQSRFAVVSEIVGTTTDGAVVWTENQYYATGIYALRPPLALTRQLRVSLKASTAVTVEIFA